MPARMMTVRMNPIVGIGDQKWLEGFLAIDPDVFELTEVIEPLKFSAPALLSRRFPSGKTSTAGVDLTCRYRTLSLVERMPGKPGEYGAHCTVHTKERRLCCRKPCSLFLKNSG